MGQQEFIRAVSFGDAQIGRQAALDVKAGSSHAMQLRRFLSGKRIDTGSIRRAHRTFPTGNIIQQEMKLGMRLSKCMFAQACNVLCGIDAPHPKIIHERTHEVVQQGFWHHPKQTIRQMLVAQAASSYAGPDLRLPSDCAQRGSVRGRGSCPPVVVSSQPTM